MKKIFAIAAALVMTAPVAEAQNLLDRAKNAAGKAIEKKMENAISNKLGINKNTPQNNNQTDETANTYGTYSSAEKVDYAARLLPEEDETIFNYSLVRFMDDNNTTSKSFKTYAEAIAAMPALPDAKIIATASALAAYRTQLTEYQGAVSNMWATYMDAVGRMNTVGIKATGKTAAPSEAQLARRQEINDALSKLSKEEVDKMEKMDEDEVYAYMQKNHPDILALLAKGTGPTTEHSGLNIDEAKVEAYDSILNQLSDMQDEANAHIYTNLLNNELQKDFSKLRKEILDSWKTSEEYAEINRMEAELELKVEDFNKNSYDKFRNYPPYWSAERKKQNAIINQWNLKQNEKWLKKIAEWQAKYKVDAEKIAALDARLEQIRNGGEEDFLYLNAKSTAAMLSEKVIRYVNLSGGIFCAPQIRHVAEEPMP